MARIIPLKGYRYDPSRVELKEVVAPPYDVISTEQRDFLHQRHPNNIVKLENEIEMPGDSFQENKYTRARRYLEEWIATGILRRDEDPSIYVYEQEYRYLEDKPKVRRGFMALARLEEQESGVILGHEQTLMPPKYDRLNLLKECRANLSPIFSLYSEPAGSIDKILAEEARKPPVYDFLDDSNIRNRFWVVSAPVVIESLTSWMKDKALIIADGHHRYETALIYRHIRRSEKSAYSENALYNYVMMMFVNLDGGGVTIYPIHRMVFGIPDFNPIRFRRKLEKYFEVTTSSFDCSNCEEITRNVLGEMERNGSAGHTFGLYLGGNKLHVLRAKDDSRLGELVENDHCESYKTLDVTIAQSVILQAILGIDTKDISKEEHVRYTPSEKTALEAVRRGDAQIALLLNPTKPEQVKAVTYAGEKMPQKSTFFYPKLLSGLVINRFDP